MPSIPQPLTRSNTNTPPTSLLDALKPISFTVLVGTVVHFPEKGLPLALTLVNARTFSSQRFWTLLSSSASLAYSLTTLFDNNASAKEKHIAASLGAGATLTLLRDRIFSRNQPR